MKIRTKNAIIYENYCESLMEIIYQLFLCTGDTCDVLLGFNFL